MIHLILTEHNQSKPTLGSVVHIMAPHMFMTQSAEKSTEYITLKKVRKVFVKQDFDF